MWDKSVLRQNPSWSIRADLAAGFALPPDDRHQYTLLTYSAATLTGAAPLAGPIQTVWILTNSRMP
jgi:hypothetical protein